MPVVKTDVETVQVSFSAGGNIGHKLLRCFACFFRSDHDGRTVRVIGTDKIHRVSLHALEPDPDIRLYVFHHVTDVKVAVGIRQGGGNKQATLAHKR